VKPLIAGLVWLVLFLILTYWFAGKRNQGTLTRWMFATIYAAFIATIPLWLGAIGGMDLSPFTLIFASAILFVSTIAGAYLLSPLLKLK
jgi:hypothetical protein